MDALFNKWFGGYYDVLGEKATWISDMMYINKFKFYKKS